MYVRATSLRGEMAGVHNLFARDEAQGILFCLPVIGGSVGPSGDNRREAEGRKGCESFWGQHGFSAPKGNRPGGWRLRRACRNPIAAGRRLGSCTLGIGLSTAGAPSWMLAHLGGPNCDCASLRFAHRTAADCGIRIRNASGSSGGIRKDSRQIAASDYMRARQLPNSRGGVRTRTSLTGHRILSLCIGLRQATSKSRNCLSSHHF